MWQQDIHIKRRPPNQIIQAQSALLDKLLHTDYIDNAGINGLLKDMSVLQGSPFTDQGSVVDIFPDLSVWQGIMAVIKQINANAGVA